MCSPAGEPRRACPRSVSLAAGIDKIERGTQVGLKHVLRLADIARENQISETLMCRDKFLTAVKTAHHHPAIAISLIVQIGMRRQKSPGSARRQQGGVEGFVK